MRGFLDANYPLIHFCEVLVFVVIWNILCDTMTLEPRERPGDIVIESFAIYLKSHGKTEATITTYMRTIERFISSNYGTVNPDEFAGNYQKWIQNDRSGSGNSTKGVHKAAGQAFSRYLTGNDKKINFIPQHPNVTVAATPWLTHEQFSQLLATMKSISGRADLYRRDVTIIETFVYTGFKVSQVSQLNVGDVNFRRNAIWNGSQWMPMADSLRESLKLWIAHRRDLRKLNDAEKREAPLFVSRNGLRMGRRTISLMIESYYLPGLKITPEILRHTFAKWLLKATNNDTQFVLSMLGTAQSKYVQPETMINPWQLRELPINAGRS
ncbi:tyrosine-type recombinase/integrase [Cohnella soli]|uniref:Tyrosine-type recombinase/integrase n=1 Tax=Cohnella soli TaxID=425005 RepID=A0ABW0HNL4_9BACL